MDFTRRTFLMGAMGAAGVATVDGLVPRWAYALPTPTPSGTTLNQTIVRGPVGAGGYTHLTTGPGEPYLQRGELAGLSSHATGDRRVLACFAQLTDVHVMDVQSPARFEYFDPYGGF